MSANGYSCTYWDAERKELSTRGCQQEGTVGEDNVLHCRCSHLTDFMGTFAKKFEAKFKSGNWDSFGPPKYVKPFLDNMGFWFVAVFNFLWIGGMMFLW